MPIYDTPALWQTGSRNLDGSKNASHDIRDVRHLMANLFSLLKWSAVVIKKLKKV
jgi:hypothetical protein